MPASESDALDMRNISQLAGKICLGAKTGRSAHAPGILSALGRAWVQPHLNSSGRVERR